MSNAGLFKGSSKVNLVTVSGAGAADVTYDDLYKEDRYATTGSIDQIVIDLTAEPVGVVALAGHNTGSIITLTVNRLVTGADVIEIRDTGSGYGAEEYARDTWNTLFLVPSGNDIDTITLDFAIPNPTSITSLFVGSSIYQEDQFWYGSTSDDTPTFAETNTGSARYFEGSEQHFREHQLNYELLSDSSAVQMNHAKRIIGKNNCLFMEDVANTHPEKWYISTLQGGRQTFASTTRKNQNLTVKEVYRWR
jgi:hypothetical protein